MPDDHSKLVPLLPIPNRTVKRLSADDSAGSRVKVGHRQALTPKRLAHARRFLLSLRKRGEKKTQKRFKSTVKTVLQSKASLIAASNEIRNQASWFCTRFLKKIQPISVGV